MSSAITLSGSGGLGRDAHTSESNCRCVYNPRTKRSVKVCRVPKSRKHRSGVAFKGNCR